MEPISKKSEVIDNYYDDYAKLLSNSLTGGIYDLGQLFWEGNPLSYMTGEDFPGIGEWATGWTPFEDDGGTFFDYDEGFKPLGFDPESVEDVGRLVSTFGVPIGGIFAAPAKAGKAMDIMSKVFPSMKYFQDLSHLNKINRAFKNWKKGTPNKVPSRLTKVWDSFLKPITQTFHRPIWAPFKKSHPFFSKTKTDKIPKWLHTRKPELDYAKTAARNWALATGARAGIEGLQYAAKKDAAPSFIKTAGASELPSYSNYVDPIMKMAPQPKPRITVEFADGTTYP
tara:strand:+ start:45 stop:893 length:849 start_codon:yes stop_codon:yes gene_type:complete